MWNVYISHFCSPAANMQYDFVSLCSTLVIGLKSIIKVSSISEQASPEFL